MMVCIVVREYGEEGHKEIKKVFVGGKAKDTAETYARELNKKGTSTSNTYGKIFYFTHSVEVFNAEEVN